MSMDLKLDHISTARLGATTKGIPNVPEDFSLDSLGQSRWHIFSEDVPLPVAVLKKRRLENNSRWMRRFVERSGVQLCPHGKTTMAPQLFQLQLDDGAWGITASTSNHVMAYRRAGVRRILMANQLVGQRNIRMILDEISADPTFDFYCLIDSSAGLDHLLKVIDEFPSSRPLQVLLEVGSVGGRTGVRDFDGAIELARRIHAATPRVVLRGIEAFEGVFDLTLENSSDPVEELLLRAVRVARGCDDLKLFAPGDIILSAGGSAYFDRVVAHFAPVRLSQTVVPVLRSGCYITHDSGYYERALARIEQRTPEIAPQGDKLSHALEICAYVQSIPEPRLAIANFGRRDASFDMGMPRPLWKFTPGVDVAPSPLPDSYRVRSLNDQHAYLEVGDERLAVGDIVGFGVSHPCTTFDKWKFLFVVDDDYRIIDAVQTFF
jgi:D-serine dehydratase